ncbi:hypothetical protein CAG37_020945 [Serratia nematodiphila]|nr:hypothetical protein CAG37_020945 [Serratia nematodiphila]
MDGTLGGIYSDYASLNTALNAKHVGREISVTQTKGNKCVGLYLQIRAGRISIGNSCEGTLPPIVIPPPPVVCNIETMNDSIDFGTRPVNELEGMEGHLWVNVQCQGGGEDGATGRLTFMNLSDGDKTEMRNGSGDVINVKLIASKSNNSNVLTFRAKDGLFDWFQVFAKIMPVNISSYGEFKGYAIVKVTID